MEHNFYESEEAIFCLNVRIFMSDGWKMWVVATLIFWCLELDIIFCGPQRWSVRRRLGGGAQNQPLLRNPGFWSALLRPLSPPVILPSNDRVGLVVESGRTARAVSSIWTTKEKKNCFGTGAFVPWKWMQSTGQSDIICEFQSIQQIESKHFVFDHFRRSFREIFWSVVTVSLGYSVPIWLGLQSKRDQQSKWSGGLHGPDINSINVSLFTQFFDYLDHRIYRFCWAQSFSKSDVLLIPIGLWYADPSYLQIRIHAHGSLLFLRQILGFRF